MASGDILAVFSPQNNEPPAASYATPDVRNSIMVLDFDAAADEAAVFRGLLPVNYAGGGVTVDLYWMASTAVTGASRWQTKFEREDLATDHDADGFATANSGGSTCSGTSGIPVKTSIAHTSGAQMDSLVAGEPFRLGVNRDADGTTGTDDMAGDAELVMAVVRET